MESKPWYASKGIWGGLTAVIGGVMGFMNIDVPQEMVAEAVTAIGAAVGGVMAIVGRWKAKTTIG